ncbi:MAG TPA: helix-turn-helix domain-containing protein [Verrucomicrobiae bacterium]|nr:helix-turn-helix domain-containing protein [Verrucomicrobiae bacterium]
MGSSDRSPSLWVAKYRVNVTCILQAIFGIVPAVVGKSQSKHRSACPVSISLEMLGDRWSLLIIRDLMVRGYRTFKEFRGSGEGIATNILSDRLRKLQAVGIITAGAEKTDARKVNYRLTEKGIGLAPVLLELLIWGARHEETGAPCAVIDEMEKNRQQVLAETRRRWQEQDPTPILPKFADREGHRNLTKARRGA